MEGSVRTLRQLFDDERRRGAIFLLAFVIFAAALIDAGYFSYRNYEQRYRREMERQLSAIADLKVNVLTQWRAERLGDGDLFFNNHAFSTLLRRFLVEVRAVEPQLQSPWCADQQLRPKLSTISRLNIARPHQPGARQPKRRVQIAARRTQEA